MDSLKKSQQNAWDIEAFDECKKILPSLSEEEQKAVYHSKWLDKGNKFFVTLICRKKNLLYFYKKMQIMLPDGEKRKEAMNETDRLQWHTGLRVCLSD